MNYSYNGSPITPAIEIYHDLVPYLAGISESEFFGDPRKCASAWRSAAAKFAQVFGERLPFINPVGAPLSYGHLVCLGAPLGSPPDSEPNVRPFAADIDEAIGIAERGLGMDFTRTDIFKHYVRMREALQAEFPEREIPFSGLGYEGPLTTAVLMRGQDFYCDLIDEPDKAARLLSLLTESIVEFAKLNRRLNGRPEIYDDAGLCDDFAALVQPSLWEEFVLPYWERYFSGLGAMTSRFVHCEGLSPKHLPLLSKVGVTHFQPSVSDMLTLDNVRAGTDIEFDWLLYAYHITNMSAEEIEAWVDRTVQAGVGKIRTQIGRYAWQSGKTDKFFAFLNAFDKYAVK